MAGQLQFNRPVQRDMALGKMTKVGCTTKTLRLEAPVGTSQDTWIAEVIGRGLEICRKVRIAMSCYDIISIYIFIHIL